MQNIRAEPEPATGGKQNAVSPYRTAAFFISEGILNMRKKTPRSNKPSSRALVPAGQTKPYPIASTTIEASQIFRVPQRHPSGEGPWQNESDKIAWTDSATGLPCTILRSEDGSLGGYVGVRNDHPLFGFTVDALPGALGISPHGGLDYAATCQRGPEETSICHPSPTARQPRRPSRGDAQASGEGREGHEPLWWFGFQCNKNHDHVPGRYPGLMPGIGHENGKTYRDEAYVYSQTTRLALQLHSIGNPSATDGTSLDPSDSSPPVGLDPERRS